jgi:NADH-quinone oxidoreductase subunit J
MPTPAEAEPGYSNTKELGRLLYTEYVYPFELASIVLLVAMIAAVALTLRKRKNVKKVDPAAQVAVKRDDRVRIVSMRAEKD